MEIRQDISRLPSRPIAFALAALAVLALLLTAWFVLSSQVQGNANYGVRIPATHAVSCGDPYSPRDPVCKPVQDPYSPHDPISAGQR